MPAALIHFFKKFETVLRILVLKHMKVLHRILFSDALSVCMTQPFSFANRALWVLLSRSIYRLVQQSVMEQMTVPAVAVLFLSPRCRIIRCNAGKKQFAHIWKTRLSTEPGEKWTLVGKVHVFVYLSESARETFGRFYLHFSWHCLDTGHILAVVEACLIHKKKKTQWKQKLFWARSANMSQWFTAEILNWNLEKSPDNFVFMLPNNRPK